MTLDIMGALRDAWRMAVRDRDLLFRVATMFLFLPQLASLLLVTDLPALPGTDANEAAMRTWLQAAAAWYQVNGVLLLAMEMARLYGGVLVITLYLGGNRPTLREAMLTALRLLPRYFVAALLVSAPMALVITPMIGIALLLPMLYLFGRMLLTGPVLVADRPVGVLAAVGRSVRLTKGNGLLMMGLSGLMLFGTELIAKPFVLLGETLNGAPTHNPVAAALIAGLAAAAVAAALLAALLLRITIYRRLAAASSRGI